MESMSQEWKEGYREIKKEADKIIKHCNNCKYFNIHIYEPKCVVRYMTGDLRLCAITCRYFERKGNE